MPQEIRLWTVSEVGGLEPIECDGLNLEARLEDWLAEDISVLGLELFVIGRQVETDYGGIIDLLCMDPAGDLVIVELKRDRSDRTTVCQLLDYASWVTDLSNRRVTEIAEDELEDDVTLEDAFEVTFGEPLPEVLNESHRMVTVSSRLDAATERIIRYLSDEHGLDINAVTFQYFPREDEELVGRVFLLDPAEVEERARRKGGSKRKPPRTLQQFEAQADEQGVGRLYRELVETFRDIFDHVERRRAHLSFTVDRNGGTGTTLNLVPGRSDPDKGLCFELYTHRAADRFGREAETIVRALPDDVEPWAYKPEADRDMRGHQGAFRSVAEGERLARLLKGTGKTGEPEAT